MAGGASPLVLNVPSVNLGYTREFYAQKCIVDTFVDRVRAYRLGPLLLFEMYP